MNILIVEDSIPIAQAYERILTDVGHTVETVSNPLVGISKCLRNTYDLLMIDIMLPEIDGSELVRRLREQHIETQIIITTNMATGYDRDELKALGVAEIALKSKIGPDQLRELVAKYTP